MRWFKLSTALLLGCLALALDVVDVMPPGSAGRPYSPLPLSEASPVVAHWRLEGPPGKVAADAEKIRDLGGRFVAETFGGPMYRSVTGASGLEFNAGDDRLFVEDNAAFALTGSLTLEAIIRCDGVAPGSTFQNQIVFRGDDRPGLDPWFLAVSLEGRLMFHIQDEQNRYTQLHSPQPLPTDRFVHIAGTLDESSKSMRLYIDGKLVVCGETNLQPMGALDPGTIPGVGIGNIQSATYPEGFNGLIAEVRISSRALQPDEFLKASPRPVGERVRAKKQLFSR
jgi:hypothetical protein